eukprot:TRINITY_DN10106_c1_g1_i1.p1 TRINITY_DN10106_c1_g1~~TRINITY_DN10106_c1_g1_i1.p1  ORF type:complete len:695 (-),score=91.27 TRINITY_DN10106_c1_g1_i1:160-2244(-)
MELLPYAQNFSADQIVSRCSLQIGEGRQHGVSALAQFPCRTRTHECLREPNLGSHSQVLERHHIAGFNPNHLAGKGEHRVMCHLSRQSNRRNHCSSQLLPALNRGSVRNLSGGVNSNCSTRVTVDRRGEDGRGARRRQAQVISAASSAASLSVDDIIDDGALTSADDEGLVSCTTFNILAPIYKRLKQGIRESEFADLWRGRNQKILDVLCRSGSSIICLQEFWIGNVELVKMYRETLDREGYEVFMLERTNNRGDGLLTAVKRDKFRVVDCQNVLFHDCGDRVAQVLRLRSLENSCSNIRRTGGRTDGTQSVESGGGRDGEESSPQLDMLLVNTHLLFPHNSNSSVIRLRQVYKILEYLEGYKAREQAPPMPIILCGDWNGSKRGQVYKFLRTQGFVSSYDVAHQYTDNDHYRWVSHLNHRGNKCGVDFIWLLNPCHGQEQALTADWKAAVFALIREQLQDAGLADREAFRFFQTAEEEEHPEHVTLNGFETAMEELGLTGEDSVGLTHAEIVELVDSADLDSNGVIDYTEFQQLFRVGNRDGQNPPEGGAQIATTSDNASKIDTNAITSTNSDKSSVPTPLLTLESSSSPTLPSPSLSDPLFSETVSRREMGKSSRLSRFTLGDTEGFEEIESEETESEGEESATVLINFTVKDAFLFPPEVEHGEWPEHYSLSDHAPLTAVFSPLLLPCPI